MKKKLMCLVMCFLLAIASTALATTTVDISPARDNPDLFEIAVDNEEDMAFITTTRSVKERSFSQERESSHYYNWFTNDILVHDYYTDSPYGVLRTWITYSADEFLNITSVTFVLNGNDYTFNNVGRASRRTTKTDDNNNPNGVQEKLLIIYGDNQSYSSFVSAMLEWANPSQDNQLVSGIPIIFHGDTDVRGTLNADVAQDWLDTVRCYADIGGKLEDSGDDATLLRVTEHQDAPQATATPEPAAAERTKYVRITNSKSVNVRVDASASSQKIASAKPGETFPYLGTKNDWHMIRLPDDRIGYVSGKMSELMYLD